MRLFSKNVNKKTRGQTMVEFALILPVLLMTMYGVMEFGRLLFIYVTTASSTREAARYAAAVGISENGVPFYNDCAGIRDAAQRVGILAGIQDSDVIIQYDDGPGGSWTHNGCPAPSGHPGLGERIVVTVTGHFDLIVPIGIVPISIQDITSSTARTIIRNVTVGDDFIIAPPVAAPPPPSPYARFVFPGSGVSEGDIATIGVQTDIRVPFTSDPVVVTIDAVDIFEAKPGVDFVWPGPLTLTFNPDSYEDAGDGDWFLNFNIEIIDDNLFEQNERAVFYISTVSNNNIGYPRLHVMTIADNDPSEIPNVAFRDPNSSVSEISTFHRIPVILDKDSGAPAWVEFEITGGTAVEGTDFTVSPSDGLLYFNTLNNATRTVNRTSEILITPINNALTTGPKSVELRLINSHNAVIIPGAGDTHTLTILDDEQCNITLTNPTLVGDLFTVNLLNSGINDYLFWIDLTFTHTGTDPQLNSVSYNSVQVASGSQYTPVRIPSLAFPWHEPVDLSFPVDAGVPKTLSFQFSNTRVNGVNLTVGFENCPSIHYP